MDITWEQLRVKDLKPYLLTKSTDEPIIAAYGLLKDNPFIVNNSGKAYLALENWTASEATHLRGWLENSIFALVCCSEIISYEKRGNYTKFDVPNVIMKEPLHVFNKSNHYFVLYGINQCIIIMDDTIKTADDMLECYKKALNNGHI